MRRNQDVKLVLMDFGAVKKMNNLSIDSPTKPLSAIIGTPGYFPPEYVTQQARFNSYIYSLGIVCIQALTGIFPGQL